MSKKLSFFMYKWYNIFENNKGWRRNIKTI